jgi:DHA1 family inner membrane transport protein
VFGVGLSIGNIAGGRLADRALSRALVGTLAGLAIVLLGLAFALSAQVPAVLLLGLLGVAAFATVAPLQLRVIEKAGSAGQNLASSLNIAAFNLGNALGAWVGGLTIDHGLGLAALPAVAATITVLGLALAVWSLRLDRLSATPIACPAE